MLPAGLRGPEPLARRRQGTKGGRMQTILPSQLRRGLIVILDGAPHAVDEVTVAGTGQSKHRVHARFRNLRNGKLTEHGFLDNEHLSVVEQEIRPVMFSYKEGDAFVFLDSESYEERKLSAEQIGERRWFLKENGEYKAVLLEGVLLDVQVADHVDMKVVETAPPQRAAQQSTYKPAKLEGGLEIMVPLFIAPGEVVRVETHTRKYGGKSGGQ